MAILLTALLVVAAACTVSKVPDGVARGSVTEAVYQTLGRTNNREMPSVASVVEGNPIVVVVPGNENFTDGMTKDSARLMIREVLSAVHTNRPSIDVRVVVTYALVDQMGVVTESPVIAATYSSATLSQMQIDTVPLDLILSSASSAVVHPTFAKGEDPVGSAGIPTI